MIAALLESQTVFPFISIQVLKEFANVSLKKKFSQSTDELKEHLAQARKSFRVAETGIETILLALDLKEQYRMIL